MLSTIGSEVKASACNAGDQGSIPGSGRSPGEGNGNPLQHSCLENPMEGGAWWATVHGVAKSRTRLSYFTFFLFFLCYHSLLVEAITSTPRFMGSDRDPCLSFKILLLFFQIVILRACLLFIYLFLSHLEACGISVPHPGMEPVPSAMEAQNLNHCTSREVPCPRLPPGCLFLKGMANNLQP